MFYMPLKNRTGEMAQQIKRDRGRERDRPHQVRW